METHSLPQRQPVHIDANPTDSLVMQLQSLHIDDYLDARTLLHLLADSHDLKLPAQQRLELLQDIETAASSALTLLRRQFSKRALPLSRWAANALADATALSQHMAFGYQAVIQEHQHSDCLTKGQLHAALAFAQSHLASLYLDSCSCYRRIPYRFWRDWHALYLAAEASRLTNAIAAGADASIKDHYLSICIMALSDIHRLSAAEQSHLHHWLLAESHILDCRHAPFTHAVGAVHIIPLNSDDPPIAAESARISNQQMLRWITLEPLAERLRFSATPALGDAMIDRLQKIWSGIRRRGHARLLLHKKVRLIAGFENLHAQLATQSAWATTEDPHWNSDEWTVRNQTRRGFGLSQRQTSAQQLQIGDLVGIGPCDTADKPGWQAGIVRWLSGDEDADLRCGVEALPYGIQAVVASCVVGHSEQQMPAILLTRSPGNEAAAIILADQINNSGARQIAVNLANSRQLFKLAKAIRLHANFTCYGLNTIAANKLLSEPEPA